MKIDTHMKSLVLLVLATLLFAACSDEAGEHDGVVADMSGDTSSDSGDQFIRDTVDEDNGIELPPDFADIADASDTPMVPNGELIQLVSEAFDGPFADMLVDDFNGDGFQDIAVLSLSGGGSVGVLLLDPNGSTHPPFTFLSHREAVLGFPVTANARLAVGDFDGDARKDIAAIAPDNGNGYVGLVLNIGFGNLSGVPILFEDPVISFDGAAFEDPVIARVGDFDANGYDDIILLIEGEMRLVMHAEAPISSFLPVQARIVEPDGLGKQLEFDGAAFMDVLVGNFTEAAGDDVLVGYAVAGGNDAIAVFGGPGFNAFEDPVISFEDPVISFEDPVISIGGIEAFMLGGELLDLSVALLETSGNDEVSDIAWLLQSAGETIVGYKLINFEDPVISFTAAVSGSPTELVPGGLITDALTGFGGSGHSRVRSLVAIDPTNNEGFAFIAGENGFGTMSEIAAMDFPEQVQAIDFNGDQVAEFYSLDDTGQLVVTHQALPQTTLDANGFTDACDITAPFCATGNRGVCGEVRDACSSCEETPEFMNTYNMSFSDTRANPACGYDADCDGIEELSRLDWIYPAPIMNFEVADLDNDEVAILAHLDNGDVRVSMVSPLSNGMMPSTLVANLTWYQWASSGDKVAIIGQTTGFEPYVFATDATGSVSSVSLAGAPAMGRDEFVLAPFNSKWAVFEFPNSTGANLIVKNVNPQAGDAGIPLALTYPTAVVDVVPVNANSQLFAAVLSATNVIHIMTFVDVMLPAVVDIDKSVVSDAIIEGLAFDGDGTDFCLAWVESDGKADQIKVQRMQNGAGGMRSVGPAQRLAWSQIADGSLQVMWTGGGCDLAWNEEVPDSPGTRITRYGTFGFSTGVSVTDIDENEAPLQRAMATDADSDSVIQIVRRDVVNPNQLTVTTMCR